MIKYEQFKNWKNTFRGNRGISLVEAMVTIFIFTLIVAGVYGTSAAGEESWEANSTRVELQQETRKSMERMINELRQAGDSSITNVPANGTWYNTITFKTPSGVSSGSLAWNASTIQYLRGGTGGKQLLRVSLGVSQVVSQNIQSLQFRRQAASTDILEVAIQAQKNTIRGKPISYQLDFNIELRN